MFKSIFVSLSLLTLSLSAQAQTVNQTIDLSSGSSIVLNPGMATRVNCGGANSIPGGTAQGYRACYCEVFNNNGYRLRLEIYDSNGKTIVERDVFMRLTKEECNDALAPHPQCR